MKNSILIIMKRVRLLYSQAILGVLFSLSILVCGCNADEEVLFWESSTEVPVAEMESNAEASANATEDTPKDETALAIDSQQRTTTMEENLQSLITVHVCGAVQKPGVYELKAGSRVMDAVLAADGFTKEADTEYVNLATLLEDGNKVRIPTKEEVTEVSINERANDDTNVRNEKTGINAGIFGAQGNPSSKEEANTRVNINTADKTLLCTLPGIGETRAESILAYRNEHGGFSKIEDIMQISGIKESSFQKIKDLITVE